MKRMEFQDFFHINHAKWFSFTSTNKKCTENLGTFKTCLIENRLLSMLRLKFKTIYACILYFDESFKWMMPCAHENQSMNKHYLDIVLFVLASFQIISQSTYALNRSVNFSANTLYIHIKATCTSVLNMAYNRFIHLHYHDNDNHHYHYHRHLRHFLRRRRHHYLNKAAKIHISANKFVKILITFSGFATTEFKLSSNSLSYPHFFILDLFFIQQTFVFPSFLPFL